jgi:hypothetical protein
MDDTQEEDLNSDRVMDSLDRIARILSGQGDQIGVELITVFRPREPENSQFEVFKWCLKRGREGGENADSFKVAKLAKGS